MALVPTGVPVAFFVLVPAVWISMRFSTPTAVSYALLNAAVLVVLTLAGAPPFHSSSAIAAQVAQLFLLVFFSITAILALARDERHALIADLRASRQDAEDAAQLRDLVIARMSDGVYVAGPGGELLFQNDAARQLLAREGPDEKTGLVEHYAIRTEQGEPYPEDELPLRRALQGETVSRAPMDISQPNGSVLHLSVDAVPLPLGHGTGALAVFRDVTRERQYQAQLSRFAAVVAHDLANPLTVFDGWLELLEERAVDPMQRSALASMQAASRRMNNLIKSLLTYSAA
jgi:signal transduction histidine kinase